ncbi:MAG: acyltransferase [Chlorobiaceae bacterium]|nr:acyltransferase [Chlorobiaceae bacterium]
MKENLAQSVEPTGSGGRKIPYDWFDGLIPSNVHLGDNVYIASSYEFDMFFSDSNDAMVLGDASGCYDQATFVTTGKSRISVGRYAIVQGTMMICTEKITIGDYFMSSWGAIITDNYMGNNLPLHARRALLENISRSPERQMPFSEAAPVTIEDNVWIGFGALVLPGTSIGRGSIIGCKSVVSGVIPEYSVVAGNPGKILRKLDPSDIRR